ncbi:MAG: hypothetical protein HZC06_07815, partial [Methylocystis sp.]|nr:hypothetical protein [Methylocystis sp.]
MLTQVDRQILKSWRQYAIEPRIAKFTGRVMRNTGPRIAIVGNCQSFGIAYAMKVLDPSATVDHFSMIARARSTMGLFAKTLETYDYVFSHDFLDGHVRGGGSEELRQRLPKTMIFPAITFAAFHPDLVYIHDSSRLHGFVAGPIGAYHSAIGLFAYRKGLSLEMANALFNENVFDALGYLDMWNDASRELLDAARDSYGVDLSAELMNWSRRGVFMYSTVHPMSFVLFDLSKKLFDKVGLKPRAVNFNYYDIHDLARSEIFPIYPAIAKRFGAQGGYMFKLQNHHISTGVGDFLNLPQFLASCYTSYSAHDLSKLSNARVDAWLADEATSGLLM